MLAAPLVALGVTVPAAALGALLWWWGWSSWLAGVVTVAALAGLTRAMHLDGLADTIDGLGAGWDRQRALAVMKSGDVGPMGVVALVLVLVGQVAAIAQLGTSWGGWLVVAIALATARAAVAIGSAQPVPGLSTTGLGALVNRSVPVVAVTLQWVLLAVAATGVIVVSGRPWWWGLLATAVAAIGVVGLVAHCVRRLGGVNGDVMGACVEWAAVLLLVTCAR